MKFVISHPDFINVFRLGESSHYEIFNEKVNKELSEKLHPSAVVESLDFMSTWKDTGGNTHVTLKGNVIDFGQQKELGGKFVWLKNLKKFRGKIWSSLEIYSDMQLLMMARSAYRKSEYREAKDFLDAVQQIENLPRSAMKLRTLAEKRI